MAKWAAAAREPHKIAFTTCHSDCEGFIIMLKNSDYESWLTRSMSHKLFANRRLVSRLTAATALQTGVALSKLLAKVSSWPYIFSK